MNKEKKLMKNTAIIAIGHICTKFISFFMLPLYTALLSNEEYGTVDLVSTFVSLAVIVLTFQLEQGVFRYLIESRGNEKKQKEYISTTFIFTIIVDIFILLIATFILLLIGYEYTWYLVGTIAVNVAISLLLQIPRGFGDNITYSIGSFISGSFNVLLNVLFIWGLGWKVEGMLLATLLAHFIAAVFLIIKVKIWKYISFKLYNKESLQKLIKYSFPLIPNTLCWWIVNASDRLVITHFMDLAANGIYSIAYKFPSLFSMVTNIFQTSWTESTAENIKESDNYIEKTMRKSIRFYSAANIGIIAIMPFLFSILVDQSFKDSYLYIPLLMTGAFLHGTANLYGSLYTALKETKKMAKTTILAAVINLVINIGLIHFIGLWAAALSTVLAYSSITIIRHFDINKYVKIRINKLAIFGEIIIYILVFGAYYSRNNIIQIVTLFITVVYCVYFNREVIYSIIKPILKKVKKIKGE